ncbi:hypothetical protein ACFO6V_27990 [Promicromonospora alba]|uniref:Uncharacterized protein n=1 Tax=Promicromonospora alba TaxID=1616110 RepID=A0ABV9HR23_9MICO
MADFKIELDLDETPAVKAAGKVGDALEQVGDEFKKLEQADIDSGQLTDVADEAGKADKATRELADAMDKAEKSAGLSNSEFKAAQGVLRLVKQQAEETGRSLEEAFNDIETYAEKAGNALDERVLAKAKELGNRGPTEIEKVQNALKDIQTAADDIDIDVDTSGIKRLDDEFDRAAKGVDDFKDEASGSMREAAASFDGSAESIQGVFQEISASALAGFGPAGALAGLATAVGAGALFNYINAEAEKTKERLAEAFQDMVDNAAGAFSQGFIEGNLANIFSGADEAVVSLEKLKRTSEETGVSVELLARAYAGDMSAMEEATEQLQRKIGDDSEILGYEAAMNTATGHTLRDLEKQRRDWNSTTSRVQGYERAIRDIPNSSRTDVRVTDNGSARKTRGEIRDLAEYAGIKRTSEMGVRLDPTQAYIDAANIREHIYRTPAIVQVKAV